MPSFIDIALLNSSGRSKRGVMERGVFAFACQYIVSPRGRTGNRTVTEMRHPLRPNCARQLLASTLLWQIVCRVTIWRLSFQKLLVFSTWEYWVKSDRLDRQVVVWPVSGTVTQCWDFKLWKPFGQHTAMKKCVRKIRAKILREKPCEK